jgi:hypothetical protein
MYFFRNYGFVIKKRGKKVILGAFNLKSTLLMDDAPTNQIYLFRLYPPEVFNFKFANFFSSFFEIMILYERAPFSKVKQIFKTT